MAAVNVKHFRASLIRYGLNVSKTSLFRRHSPTAPSTPTTVSKLRSTENKKAPIITKYSTSGFTVAGNKLIGSVAITQTEFFHWKVSKFEEITPEALTLFTVLHPQLEILVLGVGARIKQIPSNVKDHMRRRGIALEVQDTPNACATFNFLLDEGRQVGAALIPPEYVT
jgi:NADH dehydrogenase [ubiquinone] 1 alpha subcomplex assembly factor 3